MAILRKSIKESYTVIPTSITKDTRLSLRDMGLLLKMLSLPDNWEFSVKGLESIAERDGQSSICAGLKVLEDCGYLKRVRTRDKNGKLSKVEWFVYDSPHLDFPDMVSPDMEKPHMENPPQYNNKQLNNKGLNNKGCIGEDEPPPASATTAIITIPLKDGTEYAVDQELFDKLVALYPGVDTMQTLRNIAGWCFGNPDKRKTRRGVNAFITRWFCKDQEDGGTPRPKPQPYTHSADRLLAMYKACEEEDT